MRGEHNESAIFEELFLAWCVPRGQTEVQDYLEHDPGSAYGQYAFEPGLKPGMQRAVNRLAPYILAQTESHKGRAHRPALAL